MRTARAARNGYRPALPCIGCVGLLLSRRRNATSLCDVAHSEALISAVECARTLGSFLWHPVHCGIAGSSWPANSVNWTKIYKFQPNPPLADHPVGSTAYNKLVSVTANVCALKDQREVPVMPMRLAPVFAYTLARMVRRRTSPRIIQIFSQSCTTSSTETPPATLGRSRKCTSLGECSASHP